MPFHRFENIESRRLTAHLSSGEAPIIEGKYLYFCLNQKRAGTGSELHYHPNELLIFIIRGRVNAVVGRDHRIAETGTFIIIPPNVRHSMRATEDGPCAYLYIKDRTWTVVGVGADEALPDRPLTMEESEEIVRSGANSSSSSVPGVSQAIVDGVPNCFFPLTRQLQGEYRYGHHVETIQGERGMFMFHEVGPGFEKTGEGEREQFFYVCDGDVEVVAGNERRHLQAGDIVELASGISYSLAVPNGHARFVGVQATDYLVNRLDQDAGS